MPLFGLPFGYHPLAGPRFGAWGRLMALKRDELHPWEDAPLEPQFESPPPPPEILPVWRPPRRPALAPFPFVPGAFTTRRTQLFGLS